MAKTTGRLSEVERAERRAQDRERLRIAALELLSSEGWRRWVRARALFHCYSLHNSLLLAQQCHARGITARRVAGFRTWIKLGRCVRKGEKGLMIFAPIAVKQRDDDGEPGEEKRVVFRSAFVFADTQTDPLPDREPAPFEAPREPLTGDSHRHLIERLQAFARSIAFEVCFETIAGSAGGWCDPRARRIVVDAALAGNAQVRVAKRLAADRARVSRLVTLRREQLVERVLGLARRQIGRVGLRPVGRAPDHRAALGLATRILDPCRPQRLTRPLAVRLDVGRDPHAPLRTIVNGYVAGDPCLLHLHRASLR
jgi:hypothetical protein